MSDIEWELIYLVTENGRIPFKSWFEALRDLKAQSIIDARLTRLRAGNFGNCRPVGAGVLELKIDYGPGYRIYIAVPAAGRVLLLCGGDKSTQRKDIEAACQYWKSIKKRP